MLASLCYGLLAPARARCCASAGQGSRDPKFDTIKLMRRSRTVRCCRGCAWGLSRGLRRILRRTHLCGTMHSRRGCANRSRSPGTHSSRNVFSLEVSRRRQRCAWGLHQHGLAKKRKKSYTPANPFPTRWSKAIGKNLAGKEVDGGCNIRLAGDLRPRQKIQTPREEVPRHDR